MIIRDEDCKSTEFVELPIFLPEGLNRSLVGRVIVAEDVYKPLASGKPGKTVLAEKGQILDNKLLQSIVERARRASEIDDAARCARC